MAMLNNQRVTSTASWELRGLEVSKPQAMPQFWFFLGSQNTRWKIAADKQE